MKKVIFLTVNMLLISALVTGCNMLKGAGKDMENAGGSIQRTVDKND